MRTPEYIPPPDCVKGFCEEHRKTRNDSLCQKCGWNAAEAARRKDIIRNGGLTANKWGERRLVL